MPEEMKIHSAGRGALPSLKIDDLSPAGLLDIVEKVRNGTYSSLLLFPDEEREQGFLTLESSANLLFLQIWDAEAETAWVTFDPGYLDSQEEADIQASDGQSVMDRRNTIPNTAENRELMAKCVEWYAHTCEPYPGMDWLRVRF